MKNRLDNIVNKIVNEEIENFLLESVAVEHENFKFRQNIMNSWFHNYSNFSNDYDVDINESSINVNWHIVFWVNNMGVENFAAVVDSVDGVYRLDLLNKQTDKLEQQTDKDIAEVEWKFIIDEATLEANGSLYIETLEFDFKTNDCTVKFTQ